MGSNFLPCLLDALSNLFGCGSELEEGISAVIEDLNYVGYNEMADNLSSHE
jgi:hypothetical protein